MDAHKKSKPIVIIFSAPSGAGKTTIAHSFDIDPNFSFSVSATNRKPRGREENGKDYYFLTDEEFKQKIENNEFVEYEEVYPGTWYGTLKKEIERIFEQGKNIIFDVDVKGGLNLKKIFGNQAINFFVEAPSFEELERRLRDRATDSLEKIEQRLLKAKEEMTFAPRYDRILVNNILQNAIGECHEIVSEKIKEYNS